MGNRSSTRVDGGARVVRLGPRASRGRTCRERRRLVVQGGDFSCKAETCRARSSLVVRGGDFSCEAETCRGDPSSKELVEDAADWPKTRRLASVGLDQGPFSSLSRIFASTLSILAFTLSMVLDHIVF
jgi:hypothetical protein